MGRNSPVPLIGAIAFVLLALSSPAGGAASPFGVAFGEGSENLDRFIDHIHDLGIVRTKVSFYWDELEPEPGLYDFSSLDRYLTQLDPGDHGLINIFTSGWCTEEQGPCKGSPLGDCPYGRSGCRADCAEHYRAFITAVAERVKEKGSGGIKYWQRDTEPASPFPHFPTDSPEAYVEMQRIFYEAVKSVLPDAIVIGCNQNGNFTAAGEPTNADFFDYFLKNASCYFDALDLRLYDDPYTIPARVGWFRERMRSYGYERPIVSTEQGGPDPRTMYQNGHGLFKAFLAHLSESCSGKRAKGCFTAFLQEHRDQINPKFWPFYFPDDPSQDEIYTLMHAADIIERNVIILASGVEAVWWWNLRSPGVDPIFGRMRLMTNDFQPLPGYYVYKLMVEKLGGVSTVERIDVGDDRVYLYEVIAHNRPSPIYVAWRRDDGADPYDAALASPVAVVLPLRFSRVRITDPFGDETVAATVDGTLMIELSGIPLFIEEE